jgi:hypothetical protein
MEVPSLSMAPLPVKVMELAANQTLCIMSTGDYILIICVTQYACIYCTHMQASISHICLHRLHTHASHITAVVPQRVYRHGLQIETHTQVHAHPESSHACTPSVIACMYTQCRRMHVHPVSSHACASRVVACMYTQCRRVDHAVDTPVSTRVA